MIKGHRRSLKVMEGHGRSRRVKEGHGWSLPITRLTFQVRKVRGGVGWLGGGPVSGGGLKDYIVSPSPSPFPLDFEFWTWILDLNFGLGFRTWLGLDNSLHFFKAY